MEEVRISDVTLKASQLKGSLNLSFKEQLELAKLLDRLGASVIEIQGIENPQVDTLRIKSLASAIKNTKVAVPVNLDASDVDLVRDALKEAKNARLQVHTSVSPAQMEYLCGMKAPAMADAIEHAVAACAQVVDDVEFIAEDATRADAAFLSDVVSRAIKAGATTVTICDAAGAMLPGQFCQFLVSLKEAVPELNDVTLGVAYSNRLFLADACALAAVQAGAREVKASSFPLDMVSTGQFASIVANTLANSGEVSCAVDFTKLRKITSSIERICGVNDQKPSGLIQSSDPDETIMLTEHDSMEAVTECATRLGYDLTPEDAVSVYEAFRRIATKKEVVGSKELDAIVATAALQVPATYTLDNYIFNSGNTIKATARVKIMKGDDPKETVCMGDGPIDAAFAAIEEAVGRHFELDDFQIQAITEGAEAMGETVVKIVSNGKVYSGRAVSTDIVGSSIRAYINAVNKVVYEEQN